MDGIEEDSVNLSQMIRDYYEPDSRTINYHSSSEAVEDDYGSKFVSLEEILENVTDAEKEVVGKIFLYWREMEPEKLRKWIVKKLGMDCYEACLYRTSWFTNFGRPSALRYRSDYEYIDVMMKNGDDDQPVRLIVDIDFQSQFELARPTQAYQELSNSLPKIFVGTEKKLKKIISVLCSAAKQSLKERNLHVPSWRKASYMLSKWFAIDCKKISFSELDPDHTPANEPTTWGWSSGSSQLSRWTPAVVKHW